MQFSRMLRASTIISALTALCAHATLVPTLNMDKLADEATLIVVGQITLVREVGKTTVPFGDESVSAREMTAELREDKILKGVPHPSGSVEFYFTLPEQFIGWRSISPLSYRIFFLVDSSKGLRLESPYYPSLVAVPDTPVHEGTVIERVIEELAAVVESAKAPLENRREAVFALDSSGNPEAIQALMRVAEVKDVSLRLSVAAALLEHNDISALPFAEDMLLKPSPSIPPYLLHNLSYAIHEGVKDDRAVPALARLLRAGSAETRRAAASALKNVGTTSCIEPLLSALVDSDSEVRFESVVGLAEITGQPDWRPNAEDFASDQNKYVDYWRGWGKSR